MISAIAALTWVLRTLPDQHDRAAELLVGGIQQAGAVGLGQALASAAAAPAAGMGAVDQPRFDRGIK